MCNRISQRRVGDGAHFPYQPGNEGNIFVQLLSIPKWFRIFGLVSLSVSLNFATAEKITCLCSWLDSPAV